MVSVQVILEESRIFRERGFTKGTLKGRRTSSQDKLRPRVLVAHEGVRPHGGRPGRDLAAVGASKVALGGGEAEAPGGEGGLEGVVVWPLFLARSARLWREGEIKGVCNQI